MEKDTKKRGLERGGHDKEKAPSERILKVPFTHCPSWNTCWFKKESSFVTAQGPRNRTKQTPKGLVVKKNTYLPTCAFK